MMATTSGFRVGVVLALFLSASSLSSKAHAQERVPWTSSKLRGSPEPPLPYVLDRAFPISFNGPISLNRLPNSSVMLVCEQRGKVFYFDSDLDTPKTQLLVDFNEQVPQQSLVVDGDGRRIELFSIAFHPRFTENEFVFVCYIATGGGKPVTTHISRFRLSRTSKLRLDVESEFNVLTCEGGGHNGCTLAFGNDGFLYISLGDLESPTPPDPRNTGQDISDFYASILRIDIDRTTHDRNYRIPADNPFVSIADARPEVYAFGFRNPFRMSFDDATGDLWVGDVGWEAWEMVYRVRSGGNYGWAIKEGPGDVKPQQKIGPTPISPADIALGHAEAASVTGGIVYRGSQLEDLDGEYIFGDWITRKFWAATFDEEHVVSYREIAMGSVKPICFETDASGELLILDYSEANKESGIFRFRPNPAVARAHPAEFPRRLSETGLFETTALLRPASGVAAYALNVPMWRDGAVTDNFLAVPGSKQAIFYQTPQTTFDWFKTRVRLPVGAVFAKTFSVPATEPLKIETQVSLKDEGGEWQFYTYQWNADGSDAELVDAKGAQREIEFLGSDGKLKKLNWQFGSRTSCRVCHTPWVGEAIGFVESQLRRPHLDSDSWRELTRDGYINSANDHSPLADNRFRGMVAMDDFHQSVDSRARSYLHANCAHCHLFGGNASTGFDISFEKSLAESKAIDELPMRGELGLSNARVIAPGKPTQSVLLYRMAKAGSGHMPHIGSQETDFAAIQLIQQWIAQMPIVQEHRDALDTLCAPRTSPGNDTEKRRAAYRRLLGSVEGAVELAGAFAGDRVPKELTREIVKDALERPVAVRDVIEPFADSDQRVPRLGPDFEATRVLEIEGDSRRGLELFVNGTGSCSGCHKIAGVGKNIGPELSHVATKLKSKANLLHSVMQPADQIDDAYRATSVLTVDGDALIGRVIDRSNEQVVLQDANGKLITIATDEIEIEKRSRNSLMPEQLLSSLTAQQAADLIEYLWTLK